MTVEQIKNEALGLSLDERARLAELLICSLDEDVSAQETDEIEAAWVIEANRRLQEILEGNAETIPADEVMKKIRSRHQR